MGTRTLAITALVAAAAVFGQTEERRFEGVQRLTVENVNGPVEFVAGSGSTVELTAVREARGEGAEEVKLVAEQQQGDVHIYVDYPCDRGRRRDYNVKYSFRLRVPALAALDIRTVNGPMTARFTENPRRPVRLETINGAVDTTFGPRFSADVHGETMNGGVFSDFEATGLPARVSVERVNGMTRYRSNGGSFRIGTGGPEVDLKTLNGNIYIRKEQK